MSFQSVRNFLAEFDQRVHESLADFDASVRESLSPFFPGKGKKIRPALVYLSASACDIPVTEQTHDFSLLTELIHCASLFHDDVLDNAQKRRGQLSANKLLGNDIAVLLGDLLYMKALQLMQSQSIHPRRVVNNTVLNMIEAEILQGLNRNTFPEEDIYYRIIRGKTASLISLACFLGACSCKKSVWIRALMAYGEYLGIAYQMTDDMLDWKESHTGKERFSDIREGRITLPLIQLVSTMDNKEKLQCLKTLCNSSEQFRHDIAKKYYDWMIERKVFVYVEKQVNELIESAVNSLAVLPESVFLKDLRQIPSLLASREFSS